MNILQTYIVFVTLFIPHSNKHVSFWDLVHSKEQWEKEKPKAYQQLNLSQDAKKQVANLVAKFHITAKKASKNFGQDGFAEIVNQHSAMALSQAHGDGTFFSSDGQRFAVTASNLLSSYYPRYYGYYEKVINIYTHTSNQFSVYNTNAISCAPRESLYVIDGFLDNNTILAIKEHTTDTEGYTEHIFALCFLLGIDFMPRIKDLKIQQLYKVDKNVSYGEIDALLTSFHPETSPFKRANDP